jgi:salicylate synthase
MNDFFIHDLRSYSQDTIEVAGDPLILAGLIAESNLADNYLIYENQGEWFIGIGTAAVITVDASKTKLQMNGHCYQCSSAFVADSIQSALGRLPIDGWRAYGIANFELARHNHHLPNVPEVEELLRMFIPVFDVHIKKGTAVLRALGKDNLQVLVHLLQSLDSVATKAGPNPFDCRIAENKLEVTEIDSHEADRYQKWVKKGVDEIRAHKYIKVILSRTIQLPTPLDMVASYIAGRRANTPARSFLLRFDQMQAAGFSPETVVEVTKDGWVSTQPLAGTRALGANAEEENRLFQELLHDSKEIHEHAVSVQLAFEELCSVCTRDSVCITDFMTVAKRNTVQHLASRLKGRLDEGKHAWHAFHALFPAVTATGIPKRESIDAIGRFESQPRHLYSGCVMIADSDGAMDSALVLRTVFQRNKKAWLHVGAGIVDMSNPTRETEETCEKVRSVSRHLVHLSNRH